VIWVAAGLVAALGVTVALTPWIPVRGDEAWFLEVVRRVTGGERLYEEVFFGAGPVPVWVAAAAVRLSRPQIAVMRALTHAYELVLWVGGGVVLSAADAPVGAILVFTLGAVALGGHHLARTNHYAQLSTIGAVTAGAGVLLGDGLLVGAGALIAITSKYSIGVFVAMWALPLLALEASVAHAAVAVGVIAAGLLLVGLWLGPSGVRTFYATAVANKGVYLKTAATQPHRDLLQRLRVGIGSGSARFAAAFVLVAVSATDLIGVVVVVGALVFGVAASSVTALVAAVLTATGLLHAFPRADFYHLVGTTPLVVLGATLVLASAAIPAAAIALVGLALVLVLIAGGWIATRALHEVEFRRDLPHLRLLPVLRQGGVWPDDTEDLRAVTDEEVFLVRPDAQYFYLAGRVRNPTPYDYPLASTFGPDGQRRVVEAIRSGAVRWVCYPGPMRGPLAPVEIEQTLAAMTPVVQTPVGDLYTAIDAS
jgi:hypothetical protein